MKTFKKFKIDYYDKKLFDKYDIQNEKIYNYFGKTKNISQKEVMDFLNKLGDNIKEDNDKVFRYIIKVIKEMLSNYDLGYFWLTIRAMMPTEKYKNTRWHIDGKYYESERRQFKMVSVPKGEGTLFIEPCEEIHKKFVELEKEKNKEYIYENKTIINFNEVNIKYGKIFKELFEDEKIIRTKNNYYVEFNARDKEIGGIYSEPDITEPRLFFSIVLGTKEEIDELKSKNTVG